MTIQKSRSNETIWKTPLSGHFVCFFSCSKEPAIQQPVAEKKKFTFEVTFQEYNATPNPGSKWELIISSADGEIILDSVASTNTRTLFEFYSSEEVVDFSYIHYNLDQKRFNVTTYRGVDPSGWNRLGYPSFGYWGIPINRNNYGVAASVAYLNPPPFTGSPIFSQGSLLRFTSASITAQYARIDGKPIYLLLPEQGYYYLHTPSRNRDTVDLSAMPKAVRTPLNFAPYQKNRYFSLSGVTDTLNRSKDVYLDMYSISEKTPDLLYPREPFQKYDFLVGAKSDANEFFSLYCYGDSIPKVYNLLTASDYTIDASTASDFSVRFNSEKPFYYLTGWESDQLHWEVFSPVKLNQFNPGKMLDKLKTKILRGFNTSGLGLREFRMERSRTMTYDRIFSKNWINDEWFTPRDYTTVMYSKTY